jgi:hypothetical protein
MKNLLPAFVSVVGAFAISACAFNPPGERLAEQGRADKAMASSFDSDNASNDLTQAEMAAARGDWAVSAELADKSYREQPNIWNEFNLATADEHIGRMDLAEPLYVNLIERGQFVDIQPIQNFDGSWPAPMLWTVAQESARRLDRMGYAGEGAVISDTIGPYPTLGEK